MQVASPTKQQHCMYSYPLALTFHSTELQLWDDDGTVILVFNQPIEFLAEERIESYEESLDDGFSIDSPDQDGDTEDGLCEEIEDDNGDDFVPPFNDDGTCPDGRRNKLSKEDPEEDDDDDSQENGTRMSITDNRLELRWNGDLVEEDSGDPINSATYCNLGAVVLHATRGPSSNNLDLGTALGAAAPGGCLQVDMVP